MLLKKGINPHRVDGLVWYELYWRRKSTSGRKKVDPPYRARNQEVINLHALWTKQVVDRSNPKVLILFGRRVQDAYRGSLKVGHILPVTIDMDPGRVQIFVDHTQALVNRIAVCCPHPEAVFHASRLRGVGLEMDNAIQVAVDLAGLDIELNTHYFAYRESMHCQKVPELVSSFSGAAIPCLIGMLRYENEGDAPKIDYLDLPFSMKDLFTKWSGLKATRDNMEEDLWSRCPEWHVSLVKGLHILCVEKSVETRRALGFPGARPCSGNSQTQRLHVPEGRSCPWS